MQNVTKEGYIYIYLSNENDMVSEVFFDDFRVQQIESPVVQADDYYPFGLTFNGYKRENSVANKYLYNGKELQDERDLGLYDYGARFYDPAIGRFGTVDPLADAQEDFSPYHFSYNNPILYNDPTGMIGENVNGGSSLATWVHNTETDEYLWIDDGYYFTFDVSNDEFKSIKEAGSIENAGGAVYNRWFWRAVLDDFKGNPGKNEVDNFIQEWYYDIWAEAAIGIYEGKVTGAALRIGAGKLKILKKFARYVKNNKGNVKIPGTAKGGQPYENRNGNLPQKGRDGKPLTYTKYNVNPAPQHGANRGKERMVVCDQTGEVYYTRDHYEKFTRFKY